MSRKAPQSRETVTKALGQRNPIDDDLAPLLEKMWNGKSLRAACLELGLHAPSTCAWLKNDPNRDAQYAHARDGRSEFLAEDAVEMTRAAALGLEVDGQKVDAAGARGYLDAVKWQTARMSPKSGPVQRVALSVETLTGDEITAELAALGVTVRPADDEGEGEGG